MRKFLSLIAAFLIATTAANAQVGTFIRPDSSTLSSPVAGNTWLLNSTSKTISVWNGTSFQVVTTPNNNLTATTNPTSANDNTQGYTGGSIWYNTSNSNLYVCTSAATSSAVWVLNNNLGTSSIALSLLQQGGATSGQSLIWNGSAWVPSNPLVSISNLLQTGASTNQIPVWNGSAWVPTTVSTLTPPVTATQGGTGHTSLTSHGILIGQGTSAVNSMSTGAAGQIVTSNGASSDPTMQNPIAINNCRIYTVTGSPYSSGSNTGDTTLYFGPTPDKGKFVTLDDGSGNLAPFTVSEISLSLSSLTVSTVYDIYVYNNSGTLTFDSAAWTGNTPPSRGSDAAGRLTKTGATNKLLVGAIYIFSSGKTANWTGQRLVSNVFNEVSRSVIGQDTTSSWSYASSTVHAANSNTTAGQGQIQFVSCLGEQSYTFSSQNVFLSSTATVSSVGLGLDSTTAFTNPGWIAATSNNGYQNSTVNLTVGASSTLGYHYVQRLEATAGTTTFYGQTTVGNSFLTGTLSI